MKAVTYLIVLFLVFFSQTIIYAQDNTTTQADPIEIMLYSTTPIENFIPPNGMTSTGTGFFVSYLKDGIEKIFLVTNKHVIMPSLQPNINTTIKLKRADKDNNLLLGQINIVDLTNYKNKWYFNENQDIAILEFNKIYDEHRNNNPLFIRPIPANKVPNNEDYENIDMIEDVIFIGYPENKYDEINLLPIARKGLTATPIQYDFGNKPMFYIDASIFPGSSGSPVFVIQPAALCDGGASYKKSTKFYFVGIENASPTRNGDYEIGIKIPNTNEYVPIKQLQLLDLGIVIKSKEVIKTIESYLQRRN